jgi:hypothetical protein
MVGLARKSYSYPKRSRAIRGIVPVRFPCWNVPSAIVHVLHVQLVCRLGFGPFEIFGYSSGDGHLDDFTVAVYCVDDNFSVVALEQLTEDKVEQKVRYGGGAGLVVGLRLVSVWSGNSQYPVFSQNNLSVAAPLWSDGFAFPGEFIEAVIALEEYYLFAIISAAGVQEPGRLYIQFGVVGCLRDDIHRKSHGVVCGVLDQEKGLPAAVFEKAGYTFLFDLGDNLSAGSSGLGISLRGYDAGCQQGDNKQAQKGNLIGLIFSCEFCLVHIRDDNC